MIMSMRIVMCDKRDKEKFGLSSVSLAASSDSPRKPKARSISSHKLCFTVMVISSLILYDRRKKWVVKLLIETFKEFKLSIIYAGWLFQVKSAARTHY
jgi:hypothetical protein